MPNDQNNFSPRRLYRDSERGRIFGVCAGLADYFGFGVCATRMLTILACVFMPIVCLVYVALAFLLPVKPKALYKDEKEEVFWRSVRKSPSATFSSVRYKCRDLEARLQRLERYVTSSRFKLDRDFRDLERE